MIGAEAAVLPELGHQQTFVFVQFDLVNLSNFYCIYENIYKNISLQAASQQANPLLHSMATLYSPKGVAMPSLRTKLKVF